MRKSILCIVLVLLTLAAFSQREMPDLRSIEEQPDNNSEKKEKEEVKQVDYETIMVSWRLQDDYSKKQIVSPDTLNLNFHNYNPIFKKSISNNYLGYVGAPAQSNIFFDRDENLTSFLTRNIEEYRISSNEIRYYNTTTPYASLYYTQTLGETEQNFDAFFTRNIDSISNFGFNFHSIKTEAQYPNLGATHNNLSFFVSRNDERYNAYFNLTSTTSLLQENGGVRASVTDPRNSPYQASVNFSRAPETENKSFSALASFEYLMGQLPFLKTFEEDDSVVVEFVPRFALQYHAEWNNNNRYYDEKTVNTSFYERTLIRNSAQIDSADFRQFTHLLQLKALENDSARFSFGMRAFVRNDLVSASHPLAYGVRRYTYGNFYLGGEIYQRSKEFWKWSAYARVAVLGRNIGDAIIKGRIEKPFALWRDTTSLLLEGWYQDRSADIFEERWMSNHFSWDNDFKKQHELRLKAEYSLPALKANIGFNAALYQNFIYFNQEAVPDQYENEFTLVSAWLKKDIVFGRFTWSNSVNWQQVSNDAVLHLPVFAGHSNIYYKHYLFKVMKIQLGAELYYHTKFMANAYEPSTTQFYLQDDVLTGGYPLVNVYLNAKLKRTSAFARLYHANTYLRTVDYFSAPSYPLEQLSFRFGFLWTFYD